MLEGKGSSPLQGIEEAIKKIKPKNLTLCNITKHTILNPLLLEKFKVAGEDIVSDAVGLAQKVSISLAKSCKEKLSKFPVINLAHGQQKSLYINVLMNTLFLSLRMKLIFMSPEKAIKENTKHVWASNPVSGIELEATKSIIKHLEYKEEGGTEKYSSNIDLPYFDLHVDGLIDEGLLKPSAIVNRDIIKISRMAGVKTHLETKDSKDGVRVRHAIFTYSAEHEETHIPDDDLRPSVFGL